MDHLEPIRHRLRSLTISNECFPWKCVAARAIGGLTEVGYLADTDLLLVVSSQGRGLFECHTGERIARDDSEPTDDWYDETRLRARGIGPIKDQVVRLSGLHGGGLLKSGHDRWWVEAVTLDWPDEILFLGGPGGWIFDPNTPVLKLAVQREVRAFGFSDTGQSFVMATSSDLSIYSWTE
jgi:hypothetical protein